ncbi:hypothetical protein QOZ80_8AG0633240 [Eleusine coracana subsp. coracana]|nr:hypothetical protein QOZ80_8AG0633240 [Eleusine coracana subsp. coracana]
MDPEMLSLFPSGIRVLLVDDDFKFLRTASMLLSLLNFKVLTCGSPSSALKLLSAEDKIKDIDVVLADAKKATTCGFDFKAIVERDLRIPVLYFLLENHKSAGAEADALLRTLDVASFILKKPFDGDDVCNLWRDIAWRKCCLNCSKPGGDSGQGSSSGGGKGLLRPWAVSSALDDDDGEEEERVHFREIRGFRGGRKRKGVVNNPGSPSGSSSAPPVPARRRGRPAKNREQITDNVAEQETDHLAKKPCSKKAKNNGESASLPVMPGEAMDDDDEPHQPPQPKQSLFVQSVLQTLDVPPYNPSIFADAVERGSNIISFFSGSGNTTAVAPAPPPVFSSTPAPTAPALPPVNQAPQAPAPALPVVHHQQQNTPAGNVINNIIAPPAAETAMPTAVAEMEAGLQLQQLLTRAFGPFPYQGPLPPPAMQQDKFAAPLLNFNTSNIQIPLQQPSTTIAAGDLFTGSVGGGEDDIIEAADDVTQHEAGGDYGNTASTLMQSLQLVGAAARDEDDEVAGMMAAYNTTADPHLMAPQHVDDDVAAMYNYNSNDNDNNNAAMFYNDNNGDPFGAPHQVPAYDVNDPAMVGGAFDGNATAAFMAAPGFDAATQSQVATEEDPAVMFASDGNLEDYSFPLDALMAADDMQVYDAGLAGQQGSATEGTAAATHDGAGMYLDVGEGGMENWGVGPADEIALFDDMLMNNSGSDLFTHYMNDGRE